MELNDVAYLEYLTYIKKQREYWMYREKLMHHFKGHRKSVRDQLLKFWDKAMEKDQPFRMDYVIGRMKQYLLYER